MKKILKLQMMAVALCLVAAVQLGLVGCSDDPGAGSYYTQTKEYASDYLQNRSQFSEYVEILQRATGAEGKNLHLLDLLGTYGSYTVFAPTNEAIEEFLAARGVSSVAELSKEDCDTIALNSIIEQAFFTTDVSSGPYPKSNMLDQPLAVTSTAETNEAGDVKLAMFINSDARLVHVDDSVGNGVVHTVNRVVFANTDVLPDFMEKDDNIKLFCEAMRLTHMSDSLRRWKDMSYSVGSDSIDWTNDRLLFSTGSEFDNVAYMENRYYKFTVFVCPDSVLEEKYNITNIDELTAKAHELYDPMYPQDANITDPTDRRNALNRFVSYHILDRYGDYYSLTCVDGPSNKSLLAMRWKRNKIDIADWYETMMPYSILKCSYPNGNEEGLYVNRRGVQSRPDERGVKVPGAKVTFPDDMGRVNTCVNGIYHYISDIIAYDEKTQTVVLDERLRLDASTLSPDFMTSGARGIYTKSSNEGGKYGHYDLTQNHNNVQTCLGFKPGSAKNFSYDDNTHLHVRPRTISFWSYQGDEVTVIGNFDLTVKLPPVPAGDYEVRLFTCIGFPSRGIVQVFIDGTPQGIPFDMRPEGPELFGWKSDADLVDEETIDAFDKSLHNLGWMKGPKSYTSAAGEASSTDGDCFRDTHRTIRKVLGHFTSYGKDNEAHYLRFKQALKAANPKSSALNFDFLEICPRSVYNNEYYAEDKW